MRKIFFAGLSLGVIIAVAVLLSAREDADLSGTAREKPNDSRRGSAHTSPLRKGARGPRPVHEIEAESAGMKREVGTAKAVDAFDALTDKWMKPAVNGVAMADVDNFMKAFRRIPKDRQDECIHRALNLIPDENVMLLAGVLMDKAVDVDIVETVYNDILNRNESVKKPILREIFKDKTHPCWSNTAWILDATGELPERR